MLNKESVIKNNLGNEQDFFTKKPSEIQLLNENKILKKEVAFLDNINFRLGQELIELQIKFCIQPGQKIPFINSEDLNIDQAQIAYVNKEQSFLEPLLLAYDDKIVKMERILETIYDDYRDMEKKADYLISDNNTLREQLEQKCQLILNIYKEGPIIDNMGNAFLKLERDDMTERINMLSDENKELFDKFQEISGKYNEMNRRYEEEVTSGSQSLDQHMELSDQCKKLQILYEQTRHQRDILEIRLKQQIELQVFEEGEKSDLNTMINRNENEIKILKTQVYNFKRNSCEIEEKKNSEIDQLKLEIDSNKMKERESFQRLVQIEKETDFLKDENRMLVKERENNKNEQEQIMRMIDNYQSKILTLEKKEENVVKLSKQQREQLQDALLEKDKAVLKEQQVEKTLKTLNENHRQEINELKEQYDRLINNLKTKQNQLLDERENEVQQLNEQLINANFLKDKYQKENNTLQQELKKFTSSMRDELGVNKNDRVVDYERRIIELEEKVQMTDQYHSDRLHATNIEKAQIETNYKNQLNIINDLKSSNDKLRTDNQKCQNEIAQISSKSNASQKEKQLVLEEINKIKKLFENKLEYAQSQFNYKMKDVQEQLSESLKRERTSREKAIALLQNHDRIEEKMKFEYESKINELEVFIKSIKDENRILQQKRIFDEYPSKDR